MMAAPAIALRRIAGRFHRSVRADREDSVLAPPTPDSAGRYHRPGQRALYVTPEPDWAVIAIGRYMFEDGQARVVVPLDISEAWVVDQHDVETCVMLGINADRSNLPWRLSFEQGRDPPSWRNADRARAAGADGIVDRSRGILGGWHVALFRWNEAYGPQVRIAGMAVAACYPEARSRWPSPSGWIPPEERRANG